MADITLLMSWFRQTLILFMWERQTGFINFRGREMFVNPLNRLPQFRVDIANHIVWGGILGFVLLALGMQRYDCFAVVMIVSTLKKIVDYFLEGEGFGE